MYDQMLVTLDRSKTSEPISSTSSILRRGAGTQLCSHEPAVDDERSAGAET
jgi:hypothetical protein